MTLRDRIKSAASSVKERAAEGSEEARQAAQDAELSDEQRQRLQRARERAARTARRLGESGPTGDATPSLKGSTPSRTQAMFARAQEYATAGAPVQASMDPAPEPMGMWEFASAGNGGQPTQGGQPESEGANWQDNPEHLDSPSEVRNDLQADGLDPMDVEDQDEAEFGHYLTHAYADDPDRGGRSAEQLEAEHDMTVEALEEHGVDHDSPLEVADDEEHAFAFADPFGATGGMDGESSESGGASGGAWGWFDGA